MSTEGRIQAGFYKGRAIAGSEQYGINPENGNEQIAIDVAIPSLDRSFTTFLYFTEAATPYAIERLRACGWKGVDISRLTDLDANEITIGIKYETYQGKERMKVDIATGGGRVKIENQMDDRQKRAFAARMASLLKSDGGNVSPAQRSAPAQQRPPQNPAPRRGSDSIHDDEPSDDIPF